MSEHAIDQSELERIRRFEQALLSMPQVSMETTSLLHGQMYARTIFIPAGTAVTGTLTNLDNICIVSGDISVTTDNGMQRLVGYHVLPASKGYKRVGYTHRDTYWTTLIHTKSDTVEAAEDEMTSESHLLQTRRPGIEFDWASKARSDYNTFVREFGLPLGFIDAVMRRTDDLVETEACFRNMVMSESRIHGIGVVAIRDISAGECIAPARRDQMRCVAGRFTNHSHEPNAEFRATGIGDHVDMIALCDIAAGSEITVDYRTSGRVAHALEMEI
jgi:hypothetical protein